MHMRPGTTSGPVSRSTGVPSRATARRAQFKRQIQAYSKALRPYLQESLYFNSLLASY